MRILSSIVNAILLFLLPLNILLSTALLIYGLRQQSQIAKNVPKGWRTTLITNVVLSIIAEIFVWQSQLGLLAFLIALFCLVIESLFSFDLWRVSRDCLPGAFLSWGAGISSIFSLVLAVAVITFSYVAISLINS